MFAQILKENAPACLTLVHYTDLLENKGGRFCLSHPFPLLLSSLVFLAHVSFSLQFGPVDAGINVPFVENSGYQYVH